MKTNKYIAVTILLASTMAVWADADSRSGNDNSNNEWSKDNEVFHAQEFSLDLFGTVSVGQYTVNHLSNDRIRDDGRLGTGAGVNYFFDRHFGVGAEAYTENTDHFFVDDVAGNFIVRFPFDALRLAPYVFVGGGHQFDPEERWFGQAGGGVDFRFGRRWGIFADARYVAVDRADDRGLARLGLRFAL